MAALALAIAGGLAVLLLALFATHLVQEPHRSRLLGLVTLFAVGVAFVAMVALLVRPSVRNRWTGWHAGATVVAAVALVAVAWQWRAARFRITTLILVALGLAVTLAVGRGALARESYRRERAEMTRLDIRLAQAKVGTNTTALAAAKKAQEYIATGCMKGGGTLGVIVGPQTAATPRYDKPEPCVVAAQSTNTALYEVVKGRAQAAQAVAAVEVALSTPGADTRLAQAEAARAAADTAAAEKRTDRVGLLEAAAAAGRELAGLATGGEQSAAVDPGIVGWSLLLLLAVYLYRRLEILNAGLGPGPVTVELESGTETDTSGTAEESSDQIAVLRHHLLKNLPEPAAIPGGQASQSITDLIGLDPVHNKVLSAILTVVHALGFPRRGYVVRATITGSANDEDKTATTTASTSTATGDSTRSGTGTTADAGAKEKQEVGVRVLSARTGETTYTHTIQADSINDALAEAGYRAAAWIISKARAVPEWLHWDPDAAKAFLQYQQILPDGDGNAQQVRQNGNGNGQQDAVTVLKDVVADAPQCGQALVSLGQMLDLDGCQVEALEYYDRAYRIFPEYSAAFYRRALSLAMLAEGFDERPAEDQDRIRQVVDNQALTKDTLRQQALKELDRVIGSAQRLPYHKASVRERGAPPPVTWSSWQSAVGVARSAKGPTLVRNNNNFPDNEKKRLERLAKRKTTTWQVGYNLACYKATLASREPAQAATYRKAALKDLRDCLQHPNASQLRRGWLLSDPDLKPLQVPSTQAEFDRITEAVRRGGIAR